MKRNIEFLLERPIAHRGYHNINKGIPENSIRAFIEAVNNNYSIELDVHILKDNNIIVFHDDDTKRMTGKYNVLKESTYNEIKGLKLQNTNENIPLLQDVLNVVKGKVPIIIELKYDVNNFRLEKELLKILKNYNGKFAIKSFNPYSIFYFRIKKPSIIRGQLISNFQDKKRPIIKWIIENKILLNIFNRIDFISFDIDALPDKKIEKLRKNKIILGWTVRNKEKLEIVKKYCDNYIFENIKPT